jgi:hypothetical protein
MSQSSIQCLAAVDGHRSACGGAAIGTGQRVVRTGRTRNNFPTARQRRYARLALLAPPQLQRLHSLANAVLQEIDMLDIDVASTGIAPGRTEAKQSIFAGQQKLRGGCVLPNVQHVTWRQSGRRSTRQPDVGL